MKIVNVIGGLGNQLFQYAFAVALKVHHPDEEVLIDTSHFNTLFFKKYKGRNLHNGFELDSILENVITPHASAIQLMKLTYYVPNYLISRFVRKYFPKRKTEYVEQHDFIYDSKVFGERGDLYYEGYWQVATYFEGIEEQIKCAFKFKCIDSINLEWIKRIKNQKSVSIHVRRGDYVNNKGFGGICDLEYYKKALKIVFDKIENPVFYVFSNDIDWCKNNLTLMMKESNFFFVHHNMGENSYKDMELMSHCKINIIANSSFSWWAAFLNHNEEAWVIAPKKWNNYYEETDVYPKDWTLI